MDGLNLFSVIFGIATLSFAAIFICGKVKKHNQIDKPLTDVPPSHTVAEELVASSELDFAIKLLVCTPVEETNVLSPVSISLSLTVMHQGTTGDSRDQIRETILPGLSDAQFTAYQIALFKGLQTSAKGVVLTLVNKLFIASDIILNADYKNIIKKKFYVNIGSWKSNGEEKCCKEIMNFIQKATKGNSKQKFTPDMLKDLNAILISAFYVNAEWKIPFNPKATHPGDFESLNGDIYEMDFMAATKVFGYYENEKLQILSKVCKDEAFKFVWILPKNRSAMDFEEFRRNLSGKKIRSYLDQLKDRKVDVEMPKMKYASRFNLINIIENLKLEDLYMNFDFTAMANKSLTLGAGMHSARIDASLTSMKPVYEKVNEAGTVATAVTYIALGGHETVPKFHATHTFIFMLMKHSHPLMIGQFNGESEL